MLILFITKFILLFLIPKLAHELNDENVHGGILRWYLYKGKLWLILLVGKIRWDMLHNRCFISWTLPLILVLYCYILKWTYVHWLCAEIDYWKLWPKHMPVIIHYTYTGSWGRMERGRGRASAELCAPAYIFRHIPGYTCISRQYEYVNFFGRSGPQTLTLHYSSSGLVAIGLRRSRVGLSRSIGYLELVRL